jgi:hypothetical protein
VSHDPYRLQRHLGRRQASAHVPAKCATASLESSILSEEEVEVLREKTPKPRRRAKLVIRRC